ncbi:hypothetical protein O4J56_00775 [Nocardiopsis sp. RSe5-2]|uniref:Uncharacterized protein n=1 Tax=Nocardiopsis endophytica TaxID=3018445 RepID=A0ABT4TWS4_9ACTN|nr:hypothetical protein [Nocardiopsis endophytica]MDA2809159.1 hypothetical protein [Nocardiopsis endophytica]
METTTEPKAGAQAAGGVPRWAAVAAPAALVWAAAYGALRLFWALTGRPRLPPVGDDLGPFSDWPIVLLCAGTAVVAGAIAVPALRPRGRGGHWALMAAGAAVAVGTAFSSFLLILDAVGLLLLGAGGIPLHAGAVASRAACAFGAVALAAAVVAEHRRVRGRCLACGRAPGVAPAPERAPAWAFAAAYTVVAAVAVRTLAEVLAGGRENPLFPDGVGDPSAAFAAGALLVVFALAGIVLPLALVHRWGRVWPRWVLPLAGRRVPRPLVLVPGVFASAGMLCYFLMGLAALVTEGADAWGALGYPVWFFWAAIPAYVVWGLGLGVAAVSYHRTGRPRCGTCGRG